MEINRKNGTLRMNDVFDEADTQKYVKQYMFLKGHASAMNQNQTLKALALARCLHEGQHRKDGNPYLIHPLKVCSTLINLQVEDDIILAAALLHDVLEECGDNLPENGAELIQEFGIEKEVVDIIRLLTKKQGLGQQELNIYFKKIEMNSKAALIKLSDRFQNISSIYVLTDAKIRKYLDETDDFLIPMASYCKNYYPEYINQFTFLKSCIASQNNLVRQIIQKFEQAKK